MDIDDQEQYNPQAIEPYEPLAAGLEINYVDQYVNQPVPMHLPPVPVLIQDADIVMPDDLQGVQDLHQRFRQELLRDWINDIFEAQGLAQFRLPLNADLDFAEIDRIIRQHAAANDLPYVQMENINKHAWLPVTFDAVYRIRVNRRSYYGTADHLEQQLCGLKFALWKYWAYRPRVHQETIERHLSHVGTEGWFRQIMWHYLPMPTFLTLWRARRASRRVLFGREVL
jgi:hypothetical protein